ncbi:MAG: lysylphosphatidylglycerol synthase domain-containing protein [Dongiaceae bacterium]
MRIGPNGQRRLRVLIGLGIGCALLAAVFSTQDLDKVVAATRLVGGGFALVILWRFVSLGLVAQGWRHLFAPAERPAWWGAALARWICEAANNLLPVAQVGGEIARGRIIMRWPAPSGAALPLLIAVATIIVDMTLNLAGQFALALAGAWHIWRTASLDLFQLILICLAVLLPLILLALAQQPAVLARAHRNFSRLFGKGEESAGTARLSDAVSAVYARRSGFCLALLLHIAAAASRALETWFVLTLMGTPVGVMDAVTIEGLSAALRTAAFLLPAGLGVQEGALLVLCGWIGVAPSQALALALIKRGREIAVGLSGLALWALLERPRTRLI